MSIALLAITASFSGPSVPAAHAEPQDCLQATPAATAIQRTGGIVRVDVLVLVDGPTLSTAATVMNQAATAYSRLGIDIHSHLQAASLSGKTSSALHDEAKALLQGERPPGIEAVLVMTTTLEDASAADCIGGIRYRDHGFATSKYDDRSARNAIVAAHELGHVFGAHHHYANCIEGVSHEGSTLCTVMLPIRGALRFSTLNGMIVRGHVEQFAS
ncbi:MAG TPA: hypothetical protein VM600_01735 [Actinomycetota bacterium]|nr:hypothetical protein [Actinomycetota bacterium]